MNRDQLNTILAFLVAVLLLFILMACGNKAAASPLSPSYPGVDVNGEERNHDGWSETFSGRLSSKWMISNYKAGVGNNTFLAANVDLSSEMLGLRVTQSSGGSTGGEIQSRERYGFGVYTFRFRASSTATTPNGVGETVSGSTSGAFLYSNETELDFEQEGNRPLLLYCVTWKDRVRSVTPSEVKIGSTIYEDFHTYSVAWRPNSIVYSIDGMAVAAVSTNVPQQPAYIMINHWGTIDPNWGGRPTIGVERWMWVQSFSYQPL